MANLSKTIALLLLPAVLSACGQSGALYLPGNPSEVQQPVAESASQDEDEESAGNAESDTENDEQP
jgi:predicted small lipoprotein YifL